MASPDNAAASTALLSPIQDLLAMGGPAMAVLLTLSVVGVAAAIYTLIMGALAAPRPTRAVQAAVDQWCDGDFDQAQKSLQNQRNTMAGLLNYAMECRRQGQTAATAREELARRAQRLVSPLESPLKLMEVIAALAPLLGLLGTVMGMMTAFNTMAGAEGQANPAQLSGGIYEALSTTAAGLIIAIPFAALCAWLEFRFRRTQQHINDFLVRIFQVPLSGSGRTNAPRQQEENTDAPDSSTQQHHAMA